MFKFTKIYLENILGRIDLFCSLGARPNSSGPFNPLSQYGPQAVAHICTYYAKPVEISQYHYGTNISIESNWDSTLLIYRPGA